MTSDSEALKKLKARVKYLEDRQTNRWAVFSDQELVTIDGALRDTHQQPSERESTILVEIATEIRRRGLSHDEIRDLRR